MMMIIIRFNLYQGQKKEKKKEKENGMQSMKKFYVPNSQILKNKITIN